MARKTATPSTGRSAKTPRGNRRGRPPTGLKGQPWHLYPRLNVKVPPETYITLDALQRFQAVPIWRVLAASVDAYVQSLPPADQQLLKQRKRTLDAIAADRSRPTRV